MTLLISRVQTANKQNPKVENPSVNRIGTKVQGLLQFACHCSLLNGDYQEEEENNNKMMIIKASKFVGSCAKNKESINYKRK